MDKKLREWWDESAKKIIEECLCYIQDRKQALDEYKNNIENCKNEDKLLLADFNDDIKKIRQHINTINKPYLKHQEKFFVICLKSHLFNFALKTAEIEGVAEICDGLKQVYENIEKELLDIVIKFENNSPELDKSIITKCAEKINEVNSLNKACADLVDLRLELEDERDDILGGLERFVDEGTRKLSIAEQEAGLI